MKLKRRFWISFALPIFLLLLLNLPVQAQRVNAPWGDGGYNWIGDYNGDGRADIASALPDGRIIVRRSTGRGFIVTAQTVSTPRWQSAI